MCGTRVDAIDRPPSDVFQPGKCNKCTIKIVILKKKIIFREDRTVEDGQEVQQQRARALGRQQASGYGNLTRCWGAEQSKQK